MVNRSQEDIKGRRTIQDARKAEQAFFDARPCYVSVSAVMTALCTGCLVYIFNCVVF